MVGDWVSYGPYTSCRIKEIRELGVILNNGHLDSQELIPFSELKPLDITENVLFHNEFERIIDDYHFQDKNKTIFLLKVDKTIWHLVYADYGLNKNGQKYVIDYFIAELKSVHELQHALKLAGSEDGFEYIKN